MRLHHLLPIVVGIAPVRIFLMSKPPEKPILFITGHKDGSPTLDQLIALTRQLTGRDPTPQEVKEARQTLLTSSRADQAAGTPDRMAVREMSAKVTHDN
jgi:hypothetical protein